MATPIMIYDDACPMCQGYTKAFDRLGWAGRTAFSQLPGEVLERLNVDRARHEIPLYHPETGEVHYGLDSQLTVLKRGLPWLTPILRLPVLKYLLKPLYNLITYNRRVIAGTRPPATGFDCAPDFHLGWRVAYLVLSVVGVVSLQTLDNELLLALGVVTIPLLVFRKDHYNVLGGLLTIALSLSIAALLLPTTVIAILLGVELLRRMA